MFRTGLESNNIGAVDSDHAEIDKRSHSRTGDYSAPSARSFRAVFQNLVSLKRTHAAILALVGLAAQVGVSVAAVQICRRVTSRSCAGGRIPQANDERTRSRAGAILITASIPGAGGKSTRAIRGTSAEQTRTVPISVLVARIRLDVISGCKQTQKSENKNERRTNSKRRERIFHRDHKKALGSPPEQHGFFLAEAILEYTLSESKRPAISDIAADGNAQNFFMNSDSTPTPLAAIFA